MLLLRSPEGVDGQSKASPACHTRVPTLDLSALTRRAQVNDLQSACEDEMARAFAAADVNTLAEALHTALELCHRHPHSSSRLQRLVAQALMGDAAAAHKRSLWRIAAARYRPVVEGAVLEELRDRLVALCMLNAGVDADLLHDTAG